MAVLSVRNCCHTWHCWWFMRPENHLLSMKSLCKKWDILQIHMDIRIPEPSTCSSTHEVILCRSWIDLLAKPMSRVVSENTESAQNDQHFFPQVLRPSWCVMLRFWPQAVPPWWWLGTVRRFWRGRNGGETAAVFFFWLLFFVDPGNDENWWWQV